MDLAALAGLVAPLIARQLDDREVAEHVAAAIAPHLAALEASVRALDASVQARHRGIGPYVPPPHTTPN